MTGGTTETFEDSRGSMLTVSRNGKPEGPVVMIMSAATRFLATEEEEVEAGADREIEAVGTRSYPPVTK